MAIKTRVGTRELIGEIARRLDLTPREARAYLKAVCATVRELLREGHTVELGDLLSLSLRGGPEMREDESGGFSAYAPVQRTIAAEPLGGLKDDLDLSCQAAIYYIAHDDGAFKDLLSDHFGRRGWQVLHVRNGMEALSRLDRHPPVACVFEHNAEGWRELVRELKCDPKTNRVPIVGVFPEVAKDEPVDTLTVLPDDILYEPFDFVDFIRTAGSGLADRVASSEHDVTELEVHTPGGKRERREARLMIEETLFRAKLPEGFCRDVGLALKDALDNAYRHGHQNIECCTITVRMILDPHRLVLAIRDTGEGFDHAAAVAAARGSKGRFGASDPLNRAAAALKTRRGDADEGGLARILDHVSRIDFNRKGNEIVLTKSRPEPNTQIDEDTATSLKKLTKPDSR